ncbi:MAG: asparagine synthase (glutamine-hydrolyzing) [Thermogemmata sp.]|nr:asparagine synthase (glutamine-hydrolyzing) [Thermogemmata sp.]
MCGIAGILGVDIARAGPAAPRMLAQLRHRGPDDSGIVTIEDPFRSLPPVVLAHARLAIIDLSAAGHQPMRDPTQTSSTAPWLVFNGEIYNFRELAAALASEGLKVHTGTDTEVILLAYRRWGIAAIERFRGMFAFVLVDPVQRHIWFARDRLGIKPLYLYRPAGGGLLFASEVRALLAAGPDLVPRRLRPAALESFLAQGAIYGIQSHVAGIEQLPPGECLLTDWNGQVLRSWQYWSLPFVCNAAIRPVRSEVVAQLRQLAQETIRLHLIADVPLGVFLSSGIDSTAVTTLVTEVSTGPVRTVSLGFDQPAFDESPIAADFARQLGTEHISLRLGAHEIRQNLENVLAAIDQPTVDGFNTYFVSWAARQAGLTVALSGLGGDELFGGYASFRDVPEALRWARRLGRSAPWVASLIRRLGRCIKSRALIKLAELFGRSRNDLPHIYLLRRELFLPAERRLLFPLPAGCDPSTGLSPHLFDLPTSLDIENSISALELTGYMRYMLLRDADVFSMAHGLELRVPLLDHVFVEAVVRLPGYWKRPGKIRKALLVEIAGPRFPRLASRLPKRGFTFPWTQWFRDGLSTMATERLHDRTLWKKLGLDPRMPAYLWQRFLQKDPAIQGLHILGLVVLADVSYRQGLSV